MQKKQNILDISDVPHRFHFVLTEQYSMLSLSGALETLQNANTVSGQDLYDWRLISHNGQTVRSSVQSSQAVDGDFVSIGNPRDIVVVSGMGVLNIFPLL